MHKSQSFLSVTLSCLFMTLSLFDVQARTDDDIRPPAQTVEEKRQERMKKFAASHDVIVMSAGKKAKLYQAPIFSWANPERQTVGGALHMWILDGRPVATIGLWTYADTKDSYEYQSLHEGALNVRSGTGQTWSPVTPGVTFQPVPDCEPPAGTKALRLIQMRKIARQRFSSVLSPDAKLRLLPQPIYRYSEFPADVLDGAVFSFATGTDPESLLIFEARMVDGKPLWYFAFGNQTSGSVDGRLDGKVIWTNDDVGDSFELHLFRGQ